MPAVRTCVIPIVALILSLAGRDVIAATHERSESTPIDAEDGLWTEFGPPSRAWSAAVYDSLRDRLIVFGGTNGSFGDHATNDTWILPLDGKAGWQRLDVAGPAPEPGFGHAAVYDPARNRMLVFGGSVSGSLDVWALSLSGSPAWERIQAIGSAPIGRHGLSAAYDPPRDRVVIFGGVVESTGTLLNDTWALTLTGEPQWQQIVASGDPPSGRMDHSAIYDAEEDRMVVVGALRPYYSDPTEVWSLSLSGSPVWSLILGERRIPAFAVNRATFDPVRREILLIDREGQVSSLDLKAPTEWERVDIANVPYNYIRHGSALVYDSRRHRVLQYGGDHGSVEVIGFEADVWALELPPTSAPWSEVTPHPAETRLWHQAIYDQAGDRMIVYGGWEGGYSCSEPTTALSFAATPLWSKLEAVGPEPPARWQEATAYDPSRRRLLVFGGQALDGTGNYLDDLWELTLGTSAAWHRLQATGFPELRRAMAMVYDPRRDRLIIIGGDDGVTYPDDAWSLHLSGDLQWTRLETVGIAPSGIGGGPAYYDPLGDRLIIYRGANGIWTLSLSDPPTWSRATPAGDPPPATYPFTVAAAFDSLRSRLVVFGAVWNHGSVFDEYWTISLDGSPTWQHHTGSPGPRPPRRALYSTIYDATRDRIVIYGGYGDPDYMRDTWALQWSEPTPVLISFVSSKILPGSVRLVWSWAGAASISCAVERRAMDQQWSPLGKAVPDGRGRITFEDRSIAPARRYAYRLSWLEGAERRHSAETWIETAADPALALESVVPNPSQNGAIVSFRLPQAGAATLELVDVSGRRVWGGALGIMEAGKHVLRMERPTHLAAGVYLVHLRQKDRSVSARIAIMN